MSAIDAVEKAALNGKAPRVGSAEGLRTGNRQYGLPPDLENIDISSFATAQAAKQEG